MGIKNHGVDSIGVAENRTFQAGVVTRAVVVASVAEFIDHDIAGSVTDIKRIDGSDTGSGSEDVTGRGGVSFLAVHSIHHNVAVAATCTDFKPGFGLNVSVQAGGETLEVALGDDDTVVFQIAYRSEEVALVVTLGNAYIVFLT